MTKIEALRESEQEFHKWWGKTGCHHLRPGYIEAELWYAFGKEAFKAAFYLNNKVN